jgi:hypothetical protein
LNIIVSGTDPEQVAAHDDGHRLDLEQPDLTT